ncbi:unnamed protein product [Ectocarpus sp. CCAP 1310/34]|nr:unnamed protein product [Ectocarpus sp. CCAP 1310/34]
METLGDGSRCQSTSVELSEAEAGPGTEPKTEPKLAPVAPTTTSKGGQWAATPFEIDRRRNFAIISHPDAGKTTLTEKLLLYGGAIQEAGAVRSRSDQRKATSDWMELEKQRGISITSTVLSFEYAGNHINLLDTPGHQDFSEDTYRTLAAADNAVMLVDAAKGLEPQTRKLFEVCKLRELPIFTFVNKLDRPSLSPFELLDQIEREFGMKMAPVLWPIGDGEEFKGVLDRDTNTVHLFERAARTKKATDMPEIDLHDPKLPELITEELHEQLLEDVEMLDELVEPLDMERVLIGEQSPMFFGSAMTNFGVELFLKRFLTIGQKPASRRMGVQHSRMKGKQVTLAHAQQLFAQERETVLAAYPGDVIGINNPGHFAIGDTIFTGSNKIRFPGIPSFSPECFAYMRNPNPSKYKNYRKGLDQMLRERSDDGNGNPILAAVGTLQFDGGSA